MRTMLQLLVIVAIGQLWVWASATVLYIERLTDRFQLNFVLITLLMAIAVAYFAVRGVDASLDDLASKHD